MLVLALDTTTRRGSVALARDGVVVDAYAGDSAVTHGQRLPGDLTRLLDRHALAVQDIELFAVAAGPGSFTGLRIGIATMQGLALANGKDVIGISALDALHHASLLPLAPYPLPLTGEARIATWIDAQRHEVFSALYHDGLLVEGPSVESPQEVLRRWTGGKSSHRMTFVGEGAVAYANLIRVALPDAIVIAEVPMLAPSIAQLADAQARHQGSAAPDAIRPLYIRRPDAELARDRKAGR